MITLIVEAALRSCALGLVVWAALALAKPGNPHLQKTVWLAVVLASIAMPFLIGFRLAPAVQAPSSLLTLGTSTLTLSVAGSLAWAPAHWLQAATVVYALAAFALIARFATGLVGMARIRRNARVLHEPWAQSDDVRVSAKLHSPATFGSTILLPEEFSEWSEQKRAAVMSHERSHVQRRDCYVLWIARLHTCLFWINPLAWWAQSRLAALAEITSDDAVVAELGDRPAYAEVLLEIAALHPDAHLAAQAATQMAASRPHIAARIERIISETKPATAPRRRYQLLAVALLLPAVVASAASLQVPPMKLAQATQPPQDAAANENSSAPGDMEPKIIDSGDLEQLEKYYPALPKQMGIEGMVRISISLDAHGRPTDTLILDENPLEMGFGAAASALVHTFGFSNPAHKPTQLTIAVKFALKDHGNGATALPPPQSPAGG